MPSSIAWLDTSPEEQRRVREMLSLFTVKESRDELGIAQVRDALSDTLFPGTSVLQTRARYLLFIPWCFQLAASKGHRHDSLVVEAERNERILAARLSETKADGVIGRRVGAAVKNLPSGMFWHGMVRFGILTHDVPPNSLLGTSVRDGESDELATRTIGDWHPAIPAPPTGFPNLTDLTFQLTRDEADWLRLRIMDGATGTLLADLLRQGQLPDPASRAPWLDPAVRSLAHQHPALRHAERFSRLMHGADRLYAALVAERYAGEGFGPDDFTPEPWHESFTAWHAAFLQDEELAQTSWQLDELWPLVEAQNPRFSPLTRHFVEDWLSLVRTTPSEQLLAQHSRARNLIAARERRLKGSQSRLVNTKLLAQWGANPPTVRPADDTRWKAGSLAYRWNPNVRQIVTDVLTPTAEVNHA